MANNFKQGFIKRAAQHGLSPIEAEVVFDKMAAGMPGMPGGEEQDPHAQAGGPPHGQPPGGGSAQVTVNGQPLPPELAHVVMQILQKLTQGGGAGGAGGPQGGHPGMPQHGM